jgi:crotonobetainyl-CoA:carnitine CoA-transferase CaiB-like acyl-CoA transferase
MTIGPRGGPLQGVRVVEFSKVWAGPFAGKLLAFLGAEVIKVESRGALDVSRIYGVGDVDKAPGFRAVNPQKLGVQIDVKTKEGVALVLDLLGKSDVLIENLRPGAMKRLGLDYETVRAVKPDIIYVSMSMYGEEGPLSDQTGYAPCFAAFSGVSRLVGPEAGKPAGMSVRYGDSTYGTTTAFAAVVALMHRRQTGIGQYIDVSAAECLTSMVGDTIMDFTLNGRVQGANGNRHPEMAPHGVYPCRDGEWLSLAVSSDRAWRALALAMDRPDLAEHPQFRNLANRKAREDELDQLIAAWTTSRDAGDLAALLQAHGIAAAKSLSSVDLVADPQLWARGLFPEVPDRDSGTRPIVGPSWRMSRGAAITAGAPKLGEHTDYVLGEILGLSPEAQQKLADGGITR